MADPADTTATSWSVWTGAVTVFGAMGSLAAYAARRHAYATVAVPMIGRCIRWWIGSADRGLTIRFDGFPIGDGAWRRNMDVVKGTLILTNTLDFAMDVAAVSLVFDAADGSGHKWIVSPLAQTVHLPRAAERAVTVTVYNAPAWVVSGVTLRVHEDTRWAVGRPFAELSARLQCTTPTMKIL